MNNSDIITILGRWRDALRDINAVTFDVEAGDFAEGLAQRQEAISRIQAFDAELRQISAIRDEGWTAVDSATGELAEEIIAESNRISAEIIRRNSQDIEIANKIRQDAHRKLQDSSRGRGYISTLKGVENRRPIIMDDHA